MQIWLRSVVRTRDVQKSCLSVFDRPYTWAMQGYKFGWDGKKKTLTMVFVYGIPCGYTVFYCLSPGQCWGIYKIQAGWLLYCVWSQFCCLSMSQRRHEQCNQTHWYTHICNSSELYPLIIWARASFSNFAWDLVRGKWISWTNSAGRTGGTFANLLIWCRRLCAVRLDLPAGVSDGLKFHN